MLLKKIRLKVWKNKNLKKKKNTNIKPDIKLTSSDPFKRHSTEEYKANLVMVDKGLKTYGKSTQGPTTTININKIIISQ